MMPYHFIHIFHIPKISAEKPLTSGNSCCKSRLNCSTIPCPHFSSDFHKTRSRPNCSLYHEATVHNQNLNIHHVNSQRSEYYFSYFALILLLLIIFFPNLNIQISFYMVKLYAFPIISIDIFAPTYNMQTHRFANRFKTSL